MALKGSKYNVDKELTEYKKRIGEKIYLKDYIKLYNQAKNNKGRNSGKVYENTPERLQEIKDKYRNGVTTTILEEMFLEK